MDNILKPEHGMILDRVLQRCPQVNGIIEKCERCGIDVSQAREEIEMQKKMAESLKREFFPERI